MTSTPCYAFVVTGLREDEGFNERPSSGTEQNTHHAIYALACLCEHQFFNFVGASSTCETMGMITLVSCHNSFLRDRKFAHVALIRAVAAHRVSIRQQEKIGIRRYSIVTFDTSEAVDVP